uniref:PHD-type domain-containing protein n=1 Tax=Biomphalaria glabrata TaxID=6526 RepID=A0A2C9JP17_BIOGL
MASVGEGDCHKDPNFAVICSFFDKYSSSLGLPEISYTELQKYLEDTDSDVSNVLIDIHVRLLRRIGKSSVTPERFEKNIIKFIHHYSEFDAWEVESYGYKHAKLDTKLRILKNLLESQFDYNVKFKEKVNESSAEDMRFLPIGRDKEGQAYWYFLDKDMNLLVYKEEQDDDAANTWQLVCSDRQDLAKLVNSLQNDNRSQEEKDKLSTADSPSSKEGSHEKDIDRKESIIKVEENGCSESTIPVDSKERFIEIKIHKCDSIDAYKQENPEPKTVVMKKEVEDIVVKASPNKAKKTTKKTRERNGTANKGEASLTCASDVLGQSQNTSSVKDSANGPKTVCELKILNEVIDLKETNEKQEVTSCLSIAEECSGSLLLPSNQEAVLEKVDSSVAETPCAVKEVTDIRNETQKPLATHSPEDLSIFSKCLEKDKGDNLSLNETSSSSVLCEDSSVSGQISEQVLDLSTSVNTPKIVREQISDSQCLSKLDETSVEIKISEVTAGSCNNDDCTTLCNEMGKIDFTTKSKQITLPETGVDESVREVSPSTALPRTDQTSSEAETNTDSMSAKEEPSSQSKLCKTIPVNMLAANEVICPHTNKDPPDKQDDTENMNNHEKLSQDKNDLDSVLVNISDKSCKSNIETQQLTVCIDKESDSNKIDEHLTGEMREEKRNLNVSGTKIVSDEEGKLATDVSSDKTSNINEDNKVKFSDKPNETSDIHDKKSEELSPEKSTEICAIKCSKHSETCVSVEGNPVELHAVENDNSPEKNSDDALVPEKLKETCVISGKMPTESEEFKPVETPDLEKNKTTEVVPSENVSAEVSAREEKISTDVFVSEENKSTQFYLLNASVPEGNISEIPTKNIAAETSVAESIDDSVPKENVSTDASVAEENKSSEVSDPKVIVSSDALGAEESKSTEAFVPKENLSTDTSVEKENKSTAWAFDKDVSTDTVVSDDNKSIEAFVSEENKSTEASVSEEIKSTEASVSEENKLTEASVSEEIKSTEASVSEEIKSTEASVSEENKSTEASVSEEIKSTEASISEETNCTEVSVSEENKSSEVCISKEKKSIEASVSEDKKSSEALIFEENKSTETAISGENKSTEASVSIENKSMETDVSLENKATEASVSRENKSMKTDVSEEINSTETSVSKENKCNEASIFEERKSVQDSVPKETVELSKTIECSTSEQKEANANVTFTGSDKIIDINSSTALNLSKATSNNTSNTPDTIAKVDDSIIVKSENNSQLEPEESACEHEPLSQKQVSKSRTRKPKVSNKKNTLVDGTLLETKTNETFTQESQQMAGGELQKSSGNEPHRNLKRAAPEPGSDDFVDSEPNGKKAKQAVKNQKSRRGRNAAARGLAAKVAAGDTESDDSEIPLSEIRSRGQLKAARSKAGNAKTVGNNKGQENDVEENAANAKRAKKKKPGSSSEPVTEEEVTPAKKGRNLAQSSAAKKKATKVAQSNKAAKKNDPKTLAKDNEEESGGRRRSLRVQQLKAKRPPTPSSPSEVSEDEDETEGENLDKDFFDSSFTPEEESGDEEFKPKGRNFQRQAARTEHVNDEEVVNDDTPCVKCGKYNHPEMILLCDKCDAGYHTACLRPPLMLIPDGDWFCPPCEHLMLITKLLECLQALDNAMKKKDRLSKRQERLAFVGINISNILHGDRKSYTQDKKLKEDQQCQENEESDTQEDSQSSSSESESPKRTFRSERLALRQAQKRSRHEKHKQRRSRHPQSPDGEVLTKRTCRLRNAVSYQFKEFDELISNAIEDDKPCKREKPPGQYVTCIRRGKDMSNILGASDEEDEKIRLRDGDTGPPPPVLKKRTKRKLTKLDSDEEPDEDDDSEEFKLSDEEDSSEASDAEEEEDDASSTNLDSGDWKPKKTWYNSNSPSHRPKRKAKSFVVDDDDYESDERCNKRRSTRNSNRGRVHYNVWDSEDEETEIEQSTSDFCSDDSDSFSGKKKKQKAKSATAKKKGKVKEEEGSDSQSDSSIARRRKLLRKLVKKRRKDTSESPDSEIESQKKNEKSSKKKTKKSSSEDTDYSATEDSDSGESPKFKKKNVLRSSDEDTDKTVDEDAEKSFPLKEEQKPVEAELETVPVKKKPSLEVPISEGLTIEVPTKEAPAEETLKKEEIQPKPEVVPKSKPRIGPKSKMRQMKGKKRNEQQEPGNAPVASEDNVPDKVRKVSDEEAERTEEMKFAKASTVKKPPARRQRGKSKECLSEPGQLEIKPQALVDKNSDNLLVEPERQVTKKKKVPNFLDVPSGGEDSDDQKSNKSQKLSSDSTEKDTSKVDLANVSTVPQAPVELHSNYGGYPYPGQTSHPHPMQFAPNPAHYHPSHSPEDMSSFSHEHPPPHSGQPHSSHQRPMIGPSRQPPPRFDHPHFPPSHVSMNPMHQIGSPMRHPMYPPGANTNPAYHFQPGMNQGYPTQEPGEVISQAHKPMAHSNYSQHKLPPPPGVMAHSSMQQNASFHMQQPNDIPTGYMQNYSSNRMPLPKETASQGRREMVPGNAREMGPGNIREMGPGKVREMAPAPRETGSGNARDMGPGNIREMGPGKVREMAPGHREIGPGNARDMGHGNIREMGPGNVREMAPGHREIGPGNARDMGHGNIREMGPGNVREMVPGHRDIGPGSARPEREIGPSGARDIHSGSLRDLGPGESRDMGPSGPRDIVPSSARDMAHGGHREMGPGGLREMSQGGPREMSQGGPREMGQGGPREMGPGSLREMGHPYYGIQTPYHSMHQHYPGHYQGGISGHQMSSPLNSMGQMTKNLGHEHSMPQSFSHMPSTDGSREQHSTMVSPHKVETEQKQRYTPEKSEMNNVKKNEGKEGKRSKAQNKSKPRMKVTSPPMGATEPTAAVTKSSKSGMGDQEGVTDEKDVHRSVPMGDANLSVQPGVAGYKSLEQAYGGPGHMPPYPIPYTAHSQPHSLSMAHPPKHASFMPPSAHMPPNHAPTSGSSPFKPEMGQVSADIKPNIVDNKGEISKHTLSPTEQKPNVTYTTNPPQNQVKGPTEPTSNQVNPATMPYPQRYAGPPNVQGPNQIPAHGHYHYPGPYYQSYGHPAGQAMHPPNTWPQNMPPYGPRMGSPNAYPYSVHSEAMNQGYNIMTKNAPPSTKETTASNPNTTKMNPEAMNAQFSKSLRQSNSGNETDHSTTEKMDSQNPQNANKSSETKPPVEGELAKDPPKDPQHQVPHTAAQLPHRPVPSHSSSSSKSSDVLSSSQAESVSTSAPSGPKQLHHLTTAVSTAAMNSWAESMHYQQQHGVSSWPGMNDPNQIRMMQSYAASGMMGGPHYPPKFHQQHVHGNVHPDQKMGHSDGRLMGPNDGRPIGPTESRPMGPGPYLSQGYQGFEGGYPPSNALSQSQGQDYSRSSQRPDLNSKQTLKPQEDSLNLSLDQSQSGDDLAAESNAASKPKRAKTQKKSAKDGSGSGRVRSAKGRGRGRGGFMIDNLLQARGIEGEEEGEDSGEMKDIVSYVTTDEYFKQQTSS